MRPSVALVAAIAIALGFAEPSPASADAKAATAAKDEANPLFAPSPLAYQFPPFDRIKDADYLPAFERGMTENRAEIEAIAGNKEAPTFDNTIVALERSGALLGRVSRVFFGLSGANTNDAMQKIQTEIAPKLSAHSDQTVLDGKLFARIEAIHSARDELGLDAESKRLVERYYTDFVRAGAKLSDADKAKLKKINGELATLGTQFNQNLLKETNAAALVVDAKEQLKGLNDGAIRTAAEAAKSRKLDGKYVIPLLNTSGQPALASLEDRATRLKLMDASLTRGSKGGEFDNRAIVARVVKLRAERAKLLGFATHADYVLADETAGSVAAVNKLLAQLAPPAVANARAEAADIQKVIDREGGKFEVGAADWAYYTEKVRKEKYDFDNAELRPYFEADNVLRNGVFFAATKLYGITFKERRDLPGYAPEVRVFEVFNEDGSPLALFLLDLYARPGKRGGAWANAYVPQSQLLGTKPVISNNLNVPKPPAGEPTLLTWDEANTLFHEFGHALHGMFSNVKYPRFAGTSVPRDFVEYPSQVNEMWMTWPEVLANYAKHYQTGEPLPQALVDKVKATEKFNQGFATTEYLGAALLDQAYHQIDASRAPTADTILAFEADALKKAGVDFAPVPPRYRTTYFSHIMGGYSAGYYAYIWSEVLDADSVQWFKANGGLTRGNGDHFRSTLLSRGGSADALQLFRDFSGGEPDVKPLLERRGLVVKP
ncbi:MAG: M3 family metallopeptidase [Xanthomonadales bacterium]|nr:M3 family metallopeptidase [Xanthomonadales bacterium]